MKRTQDNVGFVLPGGKKRFLENSLQTPTGTACDNASLKDTDTDMLYCDPQDDMADEEAICYGAVSLKLAVFVTKYACDGTSNI